MSTQRCIANFLPSLSVKEFLLNRLRFDKVTAQSLVASFFWNTVYVNIVTKTQIGASRPPTIEDIRQTLTMLMDRTAHPALPPAPPSSPSAARTRRSIRRGRCAFFPAEGQFVPPACDGDLLAAMSVRPIPRGRAADRVGNRDYDGTGFPTRREVADRSSCHRRPPARPLATRVDAECSWAGGATVIRPISVQRLNVGSTRSENHDTNSALSGRGLFSDGQKHAQASLPRPMALRRNRSDRSAVVRGLPSKTVRTYHHLQSTSHGSQLPEVSAGRKPAACIGITTVMDVINVRKKVLKNVKNAFLYKK